jgi:5-methylcytosine-specific restriction endonuclease McrA
MASSMAVLRACLQCGVPSPNSYCAQHTPTNRRRERMGISGGRWETVRKRVLARDQGTCYICGRLGSDEVDHLKPVAEGGSSELVNLASVHSSCHIHRHQDPDWASERVSAALKALERVTGWHGTKSSNGSDRDTGGAACEEKSTRSGSV